MAQYRVEIKRSASRELERLSSRLATRILSSIQALASEPRPRGCRKLTGSQNSWRIRVGSYRVLYQIDDGQSTITAPAIGHRREVYG